MSFFGMGPLEIIIVLVVAFIFLGPERMIDAARLLGKAVREGRNLAGEIPRLVVEDDDVKLVSAGKSTSMTGQPETRKAGSADARSDGRPDDDDGPVAFSRRSSQAPQSDQRERAGPDVPQ